MLTRKLISLSMLFLLGLLASPGWSIVQKNVVAAQDEEAKFTTDVGLASCKLLMPFSTNPYFILNPGYQLSLEGEEDGEEVRVEITALDEIETIDLEAQGIGTVRARVIEEREWAEDELVEVSRNFFAQCLNTGAIYYFGESVELYEDGQISGSEGAWRAGEGENRPGLIMPGVFLLGSRYYQEYAPEIALDRAEHVAMGEEITVEAGSFNNCVTVRETTPFDPNDVSIKSYCHGVGLVIDDVVSLVNYGMVGGDSMNDMEEDDDIEDADEEGDEDDAGEEGEEDDNNNDDDDDREEDD